MTAADVLGDAYSRRPPRPIHQLGIEKDFASMRHTILLVGLLLLGGMPTPLSAQAPAPPWPVVLNVMSVERMADGSATLILPSGVRVIVQPGDIDANWSLRLQKEQKEQAASGAGPRPSVAAEACQKRWPTDFVMQKTCRAEQLKAIDALRARAMNTPTKETVRQTCMNRWTEDFVMWNQCELSQLEAASTLGR